MSKLTKNYLPEFFALGVRRARPAMVTVNLTEKCNQKCIYCEIGQDIPASVNDHLSREDLRWIVDQMAEAKIGKLSLCGGEPFLFEGITEIIEYAGERKIRCSVTTNGMTVYRLAEIELDILKRCRTEVNISIDSFTEAVQARTRGNALALVNALASVRKLMDHGIPVTVLTVISRYNYTELFRLVSTAADLGIPQVLFQPVITASNYPDRLAVERKQGLNVGSGHLDFLLEELERIRKFEQKHAIRTNVYRMIPWIRSYLETAENQNGPWFFQRVLKAFYCREIDAIIDIAYDGGIQPCGLAKSFVTIHDRREKGLMALWREATSTLREDIRHGRYHGICNGCCHHFSRNMMASLMRFPVTNSKTLLRFLPLVAERAFWGFWKKLAHR